MKYLMTAAGFAAAWSLAFSAAAQMLAEETPETSANIEVVKYQRLPSLADLVEKLQPAVVNISTTHQPGNAEADENIPGIVSANPAISDYFNPHNPQQLSLGSGFIIDKDGFIITNNHVIDGADSIVVTLADNSQFDAELIGRDSKTDIALIKIKAGKDLPTVKLGNSDKIRVGDWIVAIGNPFGLGGSVTAGIVSAKSRDIEAGPYDSFIQTDASINQGSSGGPMFNMAGEVIGINTAIFSTTGGNMGIGFAVPINLTEFVVKELKSKGKVERGWIGLKIQPNTSDIADSLGQDEPYGVVISAVEENSAAQQAGIEAGDIVTSLNGETITDARDFSRQIAETAPGSSIELSIWRNRQQRQAKLQVMKMPEEKAAPVQTPAATEEKKSGTAFITEIGIEAAEISPDIIQRYQIPDGQSGLVITKVDSGSDAEIKGLRAGNLITQIDKKAIYDLNDLRTYLDEAKQENMRPVLLLVYDHDLPHYAAVKLKKND